MFFTPRKHPLPYLYNIFLLTLVELIVASGKIFTIKLTNIDFKIDKEKVQIAHILAVNTYI